MSRKTTGETPSKSALRQQAAEALARTPEITVVKLPPGKARGLSDDEN